MKQTWLILLTFLFCLGSFSIYAEETETGAAVLTFSSFSGGGPEYAITIKDPQIVSYTCRTEYDDPDQEPMPGAGYQIIYTITGIQPGMTKMTVSMSSPLMENREDIYTVTVDENLNVTLDQEKAITRFELYRNGETAFDSYEIITFMDGYSVSVNGENFLSIDKKYVDELFQVVEKYDLYRWDGFDESQDNVLDGEGFLYGRNFHPGKWQQRISRGLLFSYWRDSGNPGQHSGGKETGKINKYDSGVPCRFIPWKQLTDRWKELFGGKLKTVADR